MYRILLYYIFLLSCFLGFFLQFIRFTQPGQHPCSNYGKVLEKMLFYWVEQIKSARNDLNTVHFILILK